MSIQILTRNLRRVASLRGFSYATESKKPGDKENTETKTESSKSTDSMYSNVSYFYPIYFVYFHNKLTFFLLFIFSFQEIEII